MVTDLGTVRTAAPTVVLATISAVTPGGVTLRVDTVLRGSATIGPLTLKSPSATHVLAVGQRIVAFASASAELVYYGKTVGGPDLEHGALLLSGFYEFDAHLVVPGLFTLAQLKTWLATGTVPTRTFVGTIGFPDGRGHVVPSSKHFVATAVPGKPTIATGFTVACAGPATMHGLDWGSIDVELSDTCLKSGQRSRSLRLSGEPTGVDAMGNMTVLVTPASPVMNEPEYDAFVADGAITDVTRPVRLDAADGSHWTWSFDETLSDGTTVRKITTNHGTTIAPPSAGSVHEDTWIYGDVTLKLTQSGSAPRVSLGTTRAVLQAIDAKVGTWTIERRGAPPLRANATQEKGVFVRR
jgi:hypothetical protein